MARTRRDLPIGALPFLVVTVLCTGMLDLTIIGSVVLVYRYGQVNSERRAGDLKDELQKVHTELQLMKTDVKVLREYHEVKPSPPSSPGEQK